MRLQQGQRHANAGVGEACVLPHLIPSRQNPRRDIINPISRYAPVHHRLRQVPRPVRRAGWHHHVQSGIRARYARMLCVPVTYHKPLIPEFCFEKVVEGIAVLAAVRVVETVVGAHDTACSGMHGMHGILEGPEVELVHGAVVEV